MPARKPPRRYWLVKSEPDVYSIDDLARDGATPWDGVRNFQARNILRDEMQVGDGVLFYHSNHKPLAVVGVARIARAGHPDHTAWEPGSRYHDPKSDPAAPTWFMVELEFVEKFDAPVTRDELAATPELSEMVLLQRGSRLSVQPVTAGQWKIVTAIGRRRR